MATFGRPSLGGSNITNSRQYIKPTKEVYSFPILPSNDIIEVLREMGVVISEDDLNKPKAEQFRQICELFIIDSLGITKEEMYTPQDDFLPTLGDISPELHDESVPVVHFLRNINKVLLAARCDEGFSLHDLMKPERSRVQRIFSALINLQKFKAEKLAWYEELQNKKNELLDKKRLLQLKQEDLRQRIAQEKAIREAEQPAIDHISTQRKQLKEELDRLRNKDEHDRNIAAEEKASIVALREAKRDLVAQLEAIKAETEIRRGQIVGSPARLKSEVSALEAAVEAEQRANDELDEQKRLLLRQMEIVAKAEKDVNKALVLMAEAEVEVKKVKNIMKDEKQRKAEAEAVTNDVDTLRGQVEHAMNQRKRAEDRLQEIQEGYTQKLAALNRAIEITRRESAELSDEIKLVTDQRRAAEAQKLQLERQQEAYTAQHSADVAEMISSMKHFSSCVTSYNTALIQNLQSIETVPMRTDTGI